MSDAIWFFDSTARIRVSHDEHPDGPAVIELSVPACATPPVHAQDEDEAVEVLSGAVTFCLDGDLHPLGPGDTLRIPAGTPHTYRVDCADGARWLVVSPHGRFERFVRAVGRPASSEGLPPQNGGLGVREAVAVTATAAANGIELLGAAS
jgi:quercetin dioxygenase-like cupin family protein